MSELILRTFITSIAATVLLFWALKIKARNWALLLLGLLPLVLIYVWNTDRNMIIATHGFLQTSVVYQIMNGNIPPENPFLAKENLLYAWGHHLLAAAICTLFRIPPPTAFALTSVLALMLTMILVFKISKFLSTDRIANVFAVFLSIFGITFFGRGPIADWLKENLLFLPPDNMRRAVPVFHKFAHANSMYLGILFFSLFLYSILHIFSKPIPSKNYYLTLTISFLGAGFFYPFHWLGLLVTCFACCLVLFLLHRRVVLRKIYAVLLCGFGGTLVVLPYIYQLSSAKSEAASVMLASPSHVLKYGFTYLLILFPISIILFWQRKLLLDLLQNQTNSTLIILTAVATTALMCFFISAPDRTEYKFAMLSFFSLGIIGGLCLRDIYLKNKIICFLIIASLTIPSSFYISQRTGRNLLIPSENSIFEEDIHLVENESSEERNLYKWIRTETERDSVFIDSLLKIPIFGQRQLYVGSGYLEGIAGGKVEDWLKRVIGHPPEIVDARAKIVSQIYSNTDRKINKHAFSELESLNDSRNVYVIVRDKLVNSKFSDDKRFEKVFDADSVGVYRLSKL